jgi:hypothetical protein
VRGETHFVIRECPIMREHRVCSTPDWAIPDPRLHRILDLEVPNPEIPDLEIQQLERILRAPAFERSQYEFTRDTTEQRVGMAKPVPGEWLVL